MSKLTTILRNAILASLIAALLASPASAGRFIKHSHKAAKANQKLLKLNVKGEKAVVPLKLKAKKSDLKSSKIKTAKFRHAHKAKNKMHQASLKKSSKKAGILAVAGAPKVLHDKLKADKLQKHGHAGHKKSKHAV